MIRRSSTSPAQRGFPRWAWLVVGVVVAIALVGGVSAWYQANPRVNEPTVSSPAATGGAGEAPNGCLGGPDNTASVLLDGQKSAARTQTGAISVAAGIWRWVAYYPRHAPEEVRAVAAAVLAQNATGQIADMEKTLTSSQTFPGLTSESLNFANSRYRVEESTPDLVRVSLTSEHIQNGKPLEVTRATTFTMVWEDGTWKVRSDGVAPSIDDIAATGAAFAGGC